MQVSSWVGNEICGTGDTGQPNPSKLIQVAYAMSELLAPRNSAGETSGGVRKCTKTGRFSLVWLVYLWADVEAQRLEIRNLLLSYTQGRGIRESLELVASED